MIFLEWFIMRNCSDVVQKFLPESSINHMSGDVFSSSNIDIDILPIVFLLFPNECFIIRRIHISEPVSWTTCSSWHGVGFAFCLGPIWQCYIDPISNICKRSLFCACWLIIIYIGK
jgi:hypothetical protein